MMDLDHMLATLSYTAFGTVVFAAVFLVVVYAVPFSVRKEIEEDQNISLAVLLGAVILGLAHIIAATVGG